MDGSSSAPLAAMLCSLIARKESERKGGKGDTLHYQIYQLSLYGGAIRLS
jgi:hypothetical protein